LIYYLLHRINIPVTDMANTFWTDFIDITTKKEHTNNRCYNKSRKDVKH